MVELWEHDDESLNVNSCLGEVVQVEHDQGDQREISRSCRVSFQLEGLGPTTLGSPVVFEPPKEIPHSNLHPRSLANQNHGAVQYNALTEDSH